MTANDPIRVPRQMTVLAALCALVTLVACTNDPYPHTDRDAKIIYTSFPEPPKTLDPAIAYSTIDHLVTGPVYDTLLEYHYLERPYRLIPGIVEAVPEPEMRDGLVVYRFRLRAGLLVQGARSVLQTAAQHQDRLSRWALELQGRRGYYRTLVAIANKNARIA